MRTFLARQRVEKHTVSVGGVVQLAVHLVELVSVAVARQPGELQLDALLHVLEVALAHAEL